MNIRIRTTLGLGLFLKFLVGKYYIHHGSLLGGIIRVTTGTTVLMWGIYVLVEGPALKIGLGWIIRVGLIVPGLIGTIGYLAKADPRSTAGLTGNTLEATKVVLWMGFLGLFLKTLALVYEHVALLELGRLV